MKSDDRTGLGCLAAGPGAGAQTEHRPYLVRGYSRFGTSPVPLTFVRVGNGHETKYLHDAGCNEEDLTD